MSSSEHEPPGDGRRQQVAGFSVFVDRVAHHRAGPTWEARVYHAEEDVEVTLPGVSPLRWAQWMADRLDRAGAHPAPSLLVELTDVDLVTAVGAIAGAPRRHRVEVELGARILGGVGLERAIGAALLDLLAGSGPGRSPDQRSTAER